MLLWLGCGRWYPPPELTKGSDERRKLASGVRDEVPAENEFGALEKATGDSNSQYFELYIFAPD